MTYTEEFFQAETDAAFTSARIVLPTLITPPCTVVDVGCGTGGWALVAQELGADITAVDYQIPAHLALVPIEDWDLAETAYPCKADLAICLEVAEHLPYESGPHLIRGLAYATRVLFSAATPGQPGINHINCQPHDYWHHLFARYGMTPEHIGATWAEPVADFYRRNAFLYARARNVAPKQQRPA